MNYINHYNLGSYSVTHQGKVIQIADKIALANYLNSLENVTIEVGYIPAGFEHRPDLISNLFYNTTTKDWLILMFNNITDPFQQLNVNDRILIPMI
jgi:hypothetical protein